MICIEIDPVLNTKVVYGSQRLSRRVAIADELNEDVYDTKQM